MHTHGVRNMFEILILNLYDAIKYFKKIKLNVMLNITSRIYFSINITDLTYEPRNEENERKYRKFFVLLEKL